MYRLDTDIVHTLLSGTGYQGAREGKHTKTNKHNKQNKTNNKTNNKNNEHKIAHSQIANTTHEMKYTTLNVQLTRGLKSSGSFTTVRARENLRPLGWFVNG